MQPGTWPGTSVKTCNAGTQPTAGVNATAHIPARDIKLGHPCKHGHFISCSRLVPVHKRALFCGCLLSFVTACASWGIQTVSLLVWANKNKSNLRREEHWKNHFLELLGPNLLFLHWFPLKVHSCLNGILPYLTRSATEPACSGDSLSHVREEAGPYHTSNSRQPACDMT